MFKPTEHSSITPCVPRNFISVSFYICMLLWKRVWINSGVHRCVPLIKCFIDFLSKMSQVEPLFNTKLWPAWRGQGGAEYLCLTSTLNPSRPCKPQRKERLFPRSDMAEKGRQAKVRKGGDSIVNELMESNGSIIVHRVKRTVFNLN